MTTFFKLADLIREIAVTESQLDYWMRLGLIVPYKDATSSGDHRQFSILNVIEVAQAVWLSVLGMSTDRMQHVFGMQRQALARVPPARRNVQAWLQYVHMVRAGATLIGLTDEPAFKTWEREVAIGMRRLSRKRFGDDELLTLVIAQQAAFGRERRPHAKR